MKRKVILILLMVVVLGWTNVSHGEQWEVVKFENSRGYVQPIAQVKNELGFGFMISGTEKDVARTASLAIPYHYHPISGEGQFIKFQVDDYKMQKKAYILELNGYGAVFYLFKEDIQQLKKGRKLKMSYYGVRGWSGAISFDLNGSDKAISYELKH